MNLVSALRRTLPAPVYRQVRKTVKARQRTTSQAGQDFWVFGEVFNGARGGFFVDVGAADGLHLSNTFLLERRFGWSGICVEADPVFFAELHRVRTAACVHACVDAEEREVEFVQRGVLGGVVDPAADNSPQLDAGLVSPMRMRTRTLASVLDEKAAPSTIDYLSVDVEGLEDRVLAGFPFDRYTFRCLTIERPKAGLRAVLAAAGYRTIKELPHLDVFYVHESFYDEYARNAIRFWWSYRA